MSFYLDGTHHILKRVFANRTDFSIHLAGKSGAFLSTTPAGLLKSGHSSARWVVGGLRRLNALTERRRIGSTASSRRPKEEIVGFKRVYTFNGGARSGKLQS